MAEPDVDVAVVGAGIVGLAVAAALASARRSVMVLEAEAGIARGVTARNSEVIHAGIYYPPGSLKARLCRRGAELLYERCERHGVPHARVGKWIVATTDAEVASLERLYENATRNGVPDLELIDADTIRAGEPDVVAAAALSSPATGIVDARALSESHLVEAESHGAQLLTQTEVVAVERQAGRWRLVLRRADGADEVLRTTAVVNAAGLGADDIASLAGLDVDDLGYRIHPCKGDYFALAPSASVRVSRLVYPVPGRAGLGVHATLDLAGRIRFGPDADYTDRPHYEVDPAKARAFGNAVRRYLPALRDEWLAADYAGVRPKLAGPGDTFRDFVVCEESERGLPGFVNCIGIESPGLTAAAAIGERVADLLASL